MENGLHIGDTETTIARERAEFAIECANEIEQISDALAKAARQSSAEQGLYFRALAMRIADLSTGVMAAIGDEMESFKALATRINGRYAVGTEIRNAEATA